MKRSYWLLAVGSWLTAPALACGPSQPNTDVRQWTDNYAYRISVDPMPPEALEPAVYKVVVRDRETNQPIENGEGRIFATSPDGANTDDGLAKGKEIGTYYARLFYVISGDWVQNVRPSTKPGY